MHDCVIFSHLHRRNNQSQFCLACLTIAPELIINEWVFFGVGPDLTILVIFDIEPNIVGPLKSLEIQIDHEILVLWKETCNEGFDGIFIYRP